MLLVKIMKYDIKTISDLNKEDEIYFSVTIVEKRIDDVNTSVFLRRQK